MDLLQEFRKKQIIRSKIQSPQQLNIWLDHCEYAIHSQFNKNNKELYKFKKRKKQVNLNYRNALQNLNRQQKVQFYLRLVNHLQNLSKGINKPPVVTQVNHDYLSGQCQCRSFNLKIWKLKNIKLDRQNHQILVENEKDLKIKTYLLRNYLFRKSKIKDKHVFVLEAINDKPHQKSRTVHIAFQDSQTLKKWQNIVKQQVQYCQWLNAKQMYQNFSPSNKLQTTQDSIKINISNPNNQNSPNSKSNISNNQKLQQQLLKVQIQLQQEQIKLVGNRKTFIQHLVNDDCSNFQEFYDIIDNQTETQVQIKKNIDFFHKIMPDYDLQQLSQFAGYQALVHQNQNFHIYKNITEPHKYKILLLFNQSIINSKQIFYMISQPRNANKINDNIEQQTTKTLLKSENSAIIYQTLKAYNKFYRLRDFVFVRHAFTHNNNFYLVDKSLDNINFPPFMTLVRGQLSVVWGIIKDEKSQQIKLVGDFVIVNAGLLNDQQEANLSLRYLNGFKQLLKQQPDNNVESSMFNIDWNIDKKQVNKKFEDIRVRRKTIQVQKQKLNPRQAKNQLKEEISFSKKSSAFYNDSSPQQSPKRQIEIEQLSQKNTSPQSSPKKLNNKISLFEQNQKKTADLKTELELVRKLDNQGYIIIDKQYLKNKFKLTPLQKNSYIQCQKVKGHAIWKGDWLRDAKDGGIVFINQKKMDQQKGVIKFVLTKIGKNILSGKSVTDISLPVDILSVQSNLERLLFSMSYGPKLLQNLNQKSIIQKMTGAVAFGISNSVLYINLDKPFNPILGQTFQCWINGCPGYGEQISHHPPISALMFFGRGYKVTCQLQSKVQLHMNSGSGSNEGIFKISFDDGAQISFVCPQSQISGLSYGDRKYNLIGKSYYWCQKQKIVLQLNFQAGKKGFFSKNDKPCDFFEGKIYQVTPQYLKIFIKNKKKQPSQKQKVKQLGSFEGIWNKYIKFNNKQILNFDENLPIRIQYQSKPLASDSNWRQDIQYRRLNKIPRAQTQKQRLQVLQRADRKFRQKYKKK